MCVLVALCVSVFVYQCMGVVGVRGRLCINYTFPLSSSTAGMSPRPNMYGSAPRWWCTLKNWLSSPWYTICDSCPLYHRNHDARVFGTTITALASKLLVCANTTPNKDSCGKQQQNMFSEWPRHVVHIVTEYVYPGCDGRMKPSVEG